jgi:hypothetical protein
MSIAEWNIALGKIASQSSLRQERMSGYHYNYDSYMYSSYGTDTDSDDVAQKAIDGCKTRSVQSNACCARSDTENYPWWMIDLGTVYPIGKVVIHRRSSERCKDFQIMDLYVS